MSSPSSYLDRLRQSAERAGLSLRAIGRELAARRNISPENARGMLYSYTEQAEPSPEVAADIAEIVKDPELATVRPLADRRRDRLGELEARVDQLELLQHGVVLRLDDLEAGREREEHRPAPPSSGSAGED